MKNKAVKTILIIMVSVTVFSAVFGSSILKMGKDEAFLPYETSDLTVTESETETTERVYSEVEFLVNTENPIPNEWKPDLVDLPNGQKVDRHAYNDLLNMLNDAKKLGFHPLICSSYRTNEKQTSLFNKKVEKYKKEGYSHDEAVAQAAMWVAYPGTSEHQSGSLLLFPMY